MSNLGRGERAGYYMGVVSAYKQCARITLSDMGELESGERPLHESEFWREIEVGGSSESGKGDVRSRAASFHSVLGMSRRRSTGAVWMADGAKGLWAGVPL